MSYLDDEKAPPGTPKTWPNWADALGQIYEPGDLVGVAVVNNKCPQMVIGTVLRINRINSKGAEITDRVWDTPDGQYARDAKLITIPSCTVTVQPEIDGRGFHRGSYSNKKETPRPVTYQLPGNIVKLAPSQTDHQGTS